MTIMRRVWGVPGIRVVKRCQQKFDCGHLFGSVEVGGEGAEFTYCNTRPRTPLFSTCARLQKRTLMPFMYIFGMEQASISGTAKRPSRTT